MSITIPGAWFVSDYCAALTFAPLCIRAPIETTHIEHVGRSEPAREHPVDAGGDLFVSMCGSPGIE